jgi:hypothetical protein
MGPRLLRSFTSARMVNPEPNLTQVLCNCRPLRHGDRKTEHLQAGQLREPLYLIDEHGHRYRLRFNCADCEMGSVY